MVVLLKKLDLLWLRLYQNASNNTRGGTPVWLDGEARAILDSFGDVLWGYFRGGYEVGNGLGELDDFEE